MTNFDKVQKSIYIFTKSKNRFSFSLSPKFDQSKFKNWFFISNPLKIDITNGFSPKNWFYISTIFKNHFLIQKLIKIKFTNCFSSKINLTFPLSSKIDSGHKNLQKSNLQIVFSRNRFYISTHFNYLQIDFSSKTLKKLNLQIDFLQKSILHFNYLQ